uniref:Arrestin_C domain-containing protein n=1 Tax=Anisakis simplex TaxID=6269 RepID=A0A0M3KED2_ANISI
LEDNFRSEGPRKTRVQIEAVGPAIPVLPEDSQAVKIGIKYRIRVLHKVLHKSEVEDESETKGTTEERSPMRPRIDHSADPPPDKILLPSDEERDKDLYHRVGPVTRQFLGRPWHRCSDHNSGESKSVDGPTSSTMETAEDKSSDRIPMALDEEQHLADESATLLLDKGSPASAVAVRIG